MFVVRVKEGVEFDVIAPAGFVILYAFQKATQELQLDLTITSGTDGDHSGPEDPHKKGEAYDLRSQGFSSQVKDQVLTVVMNILGWERFYGFLEAADTPNEHFHFQRKKGTVYP